jgi:hypothetical protein
MTLMHAATTNAPAAHPDLTALASATEGLQRVTPDQPPPEAAGESPAAGLADSSTSTAFEQVAAAIIKPAPRRPALRDIAAWRLLKMWEQGDSIEQSVTVKLIGAHEGASIVITAPDDGSFGTLREGAHYCFRGFSGESIYEFSAPLLKECSEPFAYLHIGWPQQKHVEKRERRAAARVKTELPCMIYPGSTATGRFCKGTITDLSIGGAAILLADELAIFYDQITVVFRLTVADDEVLVEARARPVRKPEETGEKLLGVSFSNLAPADRLALHAYVSTALVRELEVPLYA